jgi:hypothetical protein
VKLIIDVPLPISDVAIPNTDLRCANGQAIFKIRCWQPMKPHIKMVMPSPEAGSSVARLYLAEFGNRASKGSPLRASAKTIDERDLGEAAKEGMNIALFCPGASDSRGGPVATGIA